MSQCAHFSQNSWLTFHSRNSFICKLTIFYVQSLKFKVKIFRVKKLLKCSLSHWGTDKIFQYLTWFLYWGGTACCAHKFKDFKNGCTVTQYYYRNICTLIAIRGVFWATIQMEDDLLIQPWVIKLFGGGGSRRYYPRDTSWNYQKLRLSLLW